MAVTPIELQQPKRKQRDPTTERNTLSASVFDFALTPANNLRLLQKFPVAIQIWVLPLSVGVNVQGNASTRAAASRAVSSSASCPHEFKTKQVHPGTPYGRHPEHPSGTTCRIPELAGPTQSRYDSPGASRHNHSEGRA
jgi:hypothetical protein